MTKSQTYNADTDIVISSQLVEYDDISHTRTSRYFDREGTCVGYSITEYEEDNETFIRSTNYDADGNVQNISGNVEE